MEDQYKTNYIVVKQTKSVGVAILLTALFGPFGLFYATILGGFVMIFAPVILLVVAFFVGIFNGGNFAGLIVYIFAYPILIWVVSIIWASVAIRKYNNKILEESSYYQS